MTTPKQVAKSLAKYAQHHPILEMSSFQIPQVPGSIPRSRHVDDVAEGLLKSKKYVIPLALLSPPVAGGVALLYLTEGRFSLKQNTAVSISPVKFIRNQLERRLSGLRAQSL
jgi:hypothetical protein